MSAREASREFKAVLRAEGPLDLDTLSHAVDELKGALDVPGNAKLEINTSLRDGGRWAIVAKWDPATDTRPAVTTVNAFRRDHGLGAVEEVGICGRCQGEIIKDGSRQSGWRHVNPLADKHPANPGRPVRDNPQA